MGAPRSAPHATLIWTQVQFGRKLPVQSLCVGPLPRDSTSEYVRDLKLSARGVLYVATNRGILHRVRLPGARTSISRYVRCCGARLACQGVLETQILRSYVLQPSSPQR